MALNSDKPLITLLIVTYNQQDYIAESVSGALSQTYSPLEIIISDDFSSDKTFDIVKSIIAEYQGPHQIVLNRNESNIGLGDHLNKVINLARGELIVIGSGDDISMPQRTEVVFNEWISSGKKVKSFFSNVTLIDERGGDFGLYFNSIPDYTTNLEGFISRSNNWLDFRSQPRCWVLGCSQVIDKSLFEIYGPMDTRIIQEDGAISFRALLQGEIKYVDQALVKYRRHTSNVFQPTKVDKVLHLLKSEYFYKKSWLKDALLTHADNKLLIRILRNEEKRAYRKHNFYHLPMIGKGVLYLKKYIKVVLQYRIIQTNIKKA